MSTEAEIAAWVRSELTAIAEPVTPRPDPYGRLLRRRRLDWLRRGVVAGVAALATAGTAVALSPATTPPPPPVPTDALGWVEALVDAPPRGALAADQLFRRDLEEWVTNAVRSAAYHEDLLAIDGLLRREQEVRLIFADDIESRRIAILALRLAQPPAPDNPLVTGPGRTRVVWLVGPRGATADALASALTSQTVVGVSSGSDNAAPFTIARAGEPPTDGSTLLDPVEFADAVADMTWIGLAPPGCLVETAPADGREVWRPEPAGSYVVRTRTTYRAEYWRVTCGSTVREERPSPWSNYWQPPAEMTEPALADLAAAGLAEGWSDAVRFSSEMIFAFAGPHVSGPPRLRYAGHPPGLVSGDGTAGGQADTLVTVLVAPVSPSTWIGISGVWTRDTNGISGGTQELVVLDADPSAAGAIAVPIHVRGTARILALVPTPAVNVRLSARDGITLADSPVVEGAALLTVPESHTVTGEHGILRPVDGLRVVAYDADGSPVSTTPVVTPVGDVLATTTDWG